MFEGLTAWHERNPLLDAFCEGLDSPAPRSEATLEGSASEADAFSENSSTVPPLGREAEELKWY